jgi:hypothetical protein
MALEYAKPKRSQTPKKLLEVFGIFGSVVTFPFAPDIFALNLPPLENHLGMGQNPIPLVNIKIAGIYGCSSP